MVQHQSQGLGSSRKMASSTGTGCPKIVWAQDMQVDQVVLPKRCRQVVLQWAHEVPLVGHWGIESSWQPLCPGCVW